MEEAFSQLLEQIEHGRPEERRQAAAELANGSWDDIPDDVDYDRATQILENAGTDTADAVLRTSIMRFVGRCDCGAGTDTSLWLAAMEDQNRSVEERIAAIGAFAATVTDGPEYEPPLIAMALGDEPPEVRVAVFECFENKKHWSAIRTALKCLCDADLQVADAAAKCAWWLLGECDQGVLWDEDLEPVQAALADSRAEVRRSAIELLEKLLAGVPGPSDCGLEQFASLLEPMGQIHERAISQIREPPSGHRSDAMVASSQSHGLRVIKRIWRFTQPNPPPGASKEDVASTLIDLRKHVQEPDLLHLVDEILEILERCASVVKAVV